MNTQPEVIFVGQFAPEADELLRSILTKTTWDERLHARLTASFGAPYNYSNMSYPEVPMPNYLQNLSEAINERLGLMPSNCLINNYVEGSSSMGFHVDSIAELVPGTGVAIVSLGETRTLTFRRIQERDVR